MLTLNLWKDKLQEIPPRPAEAHDVLVTMLAHWKPSPVVSGEFQVFLSSDLVSLEPDSAISE